MLQLELAALPPRLAAFRPIHYLGSKLRLLPTVRRAVERVAGDGPICDLFAGSGTVSLAMAAWRPVISVDIQEYSRVLCSAMLSPASDARAIGLRIAEEALASDLHARLTQAVAPLLDHEDTCARRASAGDLGPLCDLIDYGSLTWFQNTGSTGASPALQRALACAAERLHTAGLSGVAGSLITRHFAGSYFSFRQATALDALLEAAHQLPSGMRDGAVAAVLSTSSDIVNSVGKHFAQPLRPRDSEGKPKRHLVDNIVKDRGCDVGSVYRDWIERFGRLPRTRGPHSAIREDYHSFLIRAKAPMGAFYADPPYTRDHYSRFYHVLETMCLRDEPTVSTSMIRTGGTPRVSRGSYRVDRHQSPFCIKSQAPEAFAKLFAAVRTFDAPLVLSYSPYSLAANHRPRLMSVSGIVELARKHFRRVEVQSAGAFAHSKLNLQARNVPGSQEAEVLIISQP